MEDIIQKIEHYIPNFQEIAVTIGWDIALAILALLIGFWLAGKARLFILYLSERSERIDTTLAVFFASFARYIIITITLIIVLETFGFKTTSLVALLGAAGLAIGLALQGTLSNIAAGVMLLIFRPFKVDQYIRVAGEEGTVKSISLFTTEIDTGDNIRIIIPNSAVWGSSIVNVSYHPRRRIQLVFGIGYDSDINKAMATIRSVVNDHSATLHDPAPLVAVTNLGDSSVDIMLRFWVESGDFFPAQWDVTKSVKEAFDKDGIDIPYPTTTIVQASNTE